MGAKKVVRKKATKRSRPKKPTKPSSTKAGRTRKSAAKRKVTVRKKATLRATSPKRVGAKRGKAAAALGRPRVAGTAELELMFRKDLEAREVFQFLGVKTLKELETFTPDEVLERLTAPMVRTVGRIRKALAMNNRCLAGDLKFAVSFKKQLS